MTLDSVPQQENH